MNMNAPALVAAILAVGTAANAGTAITYTPYTITAPGDYYIDQSFSKSSNGALITVSSNNVTLDLHGNSLTAYDIGIASSGVKNLVVQNGTINVTAGGWCWAYTGNTADTNVTITNLSIKSAGLGILLHGTNNEFYNSTITAYRGIWLSASNSRIHDVSVQGASGTGLHAVSIGGSNDVVENSHFSKFSYAFELESTPTASSIFRNNVFSNVDTPNHYSNNGGNISYVPVFVNNIWNNGSTTIPTGFTGTGNLFY